MSKWISWFVLFVSAGLVFVLTACKPDLLSDSNSFLKEFTGRGLLDVLGVILAITLASAGQLHLTLNQIEERHRRSAFEKTRKGIKQASHVLIGLFLFAVALVFVKPWLALEPWSQSLFNGAALFVLLWNVLILIALTQGTFAVKPDFGQTP